MTPSDELWIRLVWFTKLRWIIPVALTAMAWALEMWTGLVVPMRIALVLLFGLLALNTGYTLLLKRWQGEPAAHGRGLRRLAHVQVLGDIAMNLTAMYVTGGADSPFWPVCTLTVLIAALFFPRRLAI